MLSSLNRALDQRRRRWLLLAAAAMLVAFGAILVELRRIQADLDAGQETLTDIELAGVEERGGIAAIADGAADRLDAADERARSSPVLRVLSVLPGIGGQVDALRDMTSAIAEVGGRGRDAAAVIDGALETASGPAARLATVRTVRAEIADLRASVEAVDIGADGWLIPPLAAARRDISIRLADARSDLARSSELVTALEGFLTGPRRYLVLGGNNAEMRAVGIPTTSGIADIANGEVNVGEFSAATDAIELPEPGVPVPLEFEILYGWLNGDRGYRTALATPNWPVAAQICADITARNSYGPVDGVIYVDTITLRGLLGVIGPVEVGGVEYDEDNILEELLYRNYLRFATGEDSPERRALQSDIAQTIFEQINQREYSVLDLAATLSELARGRHLLAWAQDDAENRLWTTFGADGRLLPDGILVATQELGASKLDYFIRHVIELRARRSDDGDWRVTLEIDLEHHEHGETSPYIDGGGMYARPGEYGAFLLSYLPGDAYNIDSSRGFSYHGRDGPMYAAGSILRVPEGATETVEVEFSLPRERDALTVIPSTRLRPSVWEWGDGLSRDDVTPFEIVLSDAEE